MAVLDEVRAALVGVDMPAWRRELALSLAESMDKAANASIAKELRSLMEDVGGEPAKQGDVSDDLAAKRAARRSAAG